MHEEYFGDYFKEIAEKFGFTGVLYDKERNAIIFPTASESSDQIPETLRGQPAAFFAFLAGAVSIGSKHITLQPYQDGILLHIKGSETYDTGYFLSQRKALLKKIDQVKTQQDICNIYRDLIEDFKNFIEKSGLILPEPQNKISSEAELRIKEEEPFVPPEKGSIQRVRVPHTHIPAVTTENNAPSFTELLDRIHPDPRKHTGRKSL